MSRSRKKPWATLTKRWSKWKERGFRRKIKRACRDAEFDFDPDRDFDDLTQSHKHFAHEMGTRLGFNQAPHENDDTWEHDEFERLKRK